MAEITYSNVDNEISDFINKSFDNTFRKGYTKANGVMLPVSFKKFGQCILDMEIRDDDVWVCSFPKTGTTWCQEMTWCIGNNVDLEGAKQLLVERFPYLE
ncbi:luciferin sulfotransferase-like [Aphis gossypii]|nr:luciferin sulfotransferase-like [Aphis gossypii]